MSCGENCLQCVTGPNDCTLCSTNASINVEGSCTCNLSFYPDEIGECQQCDDDCLTCAESGKCLTCPQGTVKATDRCVTCSESEYIEGDQCLSCDEKLPYCNSCALQDVDQLICKDCQDTFSLDDSANECACAEGTFLDQTSLSCKSCFEGCAECSSSDTCTRCSDQNNLVFKESNCVPENCAEGTYRSELDGSCQACSSNCGTCEQQ